MNTKVLHTLEYDKIIQLLIDKATSAPGREQCRRLIPSTDLSAIEAAQQETGDALSMLLTKGSTSFGGNKDLQFAIKSLEIGSALSIPELLGIAGLLQNTARIKSYGRKAREEDADTSLTP